MRRSLAVAAMLCWATTSAGCAELGPTDAKQADHSYDGPLRLSSAASAHPRAGAAGNIVECATWGGGGSSEEVYDGGATAGSPEEALAVARSEGGFGGAQHGLQVARKEEDRVLFVVEVDGAVKQAVIVRDGPATEGAGGPGWYVESWAHCDFSELPRAFTDSIGLQVWSDDAGSPVPTRTIATWTGPEHCDWQSMTFLHMGDAVYVRDPEPELADYVADPYAEHADVPGDAIDTGFVRDGEHLWLSADEDLAYVGAENDAEIWPRAVRPLGCA